ncbi:hypothetical protein AJ79_03279 [Helicocarpus griseus UAMH5409]|uniref:Enoyl reductase (ER) domain-containing protein n=1 Tax=Helicocarpus griseus UAMH5409 TaxID=1447875 RepID=A0A2B7XYA6_9EURO|nr:hypothetical protein AJ79_03279 [Helicocarpus griseus UAMH5409]
MMVVTQQTPRTHNPTLAEQEAIPPRMPALLLPLPLPSTKAPFPYTPFTNPPPPSLLTHTLTHPTPTPSPSQYLIKVQTAALTRGELGWPETLSPNHPSIPSTGHPTSTSSSSDNNDDGGAGARDGDNNNENYYVIPAHEIAGIVLSTPQTDEHMSTGPKFKVGDEVIGLLAFERDGGAADVAVAEEGELAFKPRNVGAAEAAGVVMGGLTGWQGLVEYGGLVDGSKEVTRVLVLNASGGVGVMVCQLLRAEMLFGGGEDAKRRFWVCGVCSGKNAEFVRGELGVDEVLNYRVEEEEKGGRRGNDDNRGESGWLAEAFRKRGWPPVDLVMDCIGGDTLRQAYDPAVVRDGGRVVSVAQPVPEKEKEWEGVRAEIERRRLISRFFIVRPDGEQLAKISKLVEEGELKPVVEREMELYQGREAMELVESGRIRGKVVLRVSFYDR